MNKHEFIERIAAEAHINKEDAHAAIKAACQVLADALARGERVTLPDFGTFEVRDHAGRKVRNPRTGAIMQIESSKIPMLKAGQKLVDAVNNAILSE